MVFIASVGKTKIGSGVNVMTEINLKYLGLSRSIMRRFYSPFFRHCADDAASICAFAAVEAESAEDLQTASRIINRSFRIELKNYGFAFEPVTRKLFIPESKTVFDSSAKEIRQFYRADIRGHHENSVVPDNCRMVVCHFCAAPVLRSVYETKRFIKFFCSRSCQARELCRKLRAGEVVRASGTRHGRAKLDQLKVSEIKTKLAGKLSINRIAKQYGVDYKAIVSIKNGVTWQNVAAAET